MISLKEKLKFAKGITLVSLAITVIILLILGTVSIGMILNNKDVISITETATKETNKQAATETINFKITNAQMIKYTEEQRLPTLKEVADIFCKDDDFKYVYETSQIASLKPISNENPTSIFTKLKAYPYEFEINSSLQLASIDGIKIANNENLSNEYVSKEQYESLLARVVALENKQEVDAATEYKPGDEITYNMILTSGVMTDSRKQLIFSIFLGKNISKDVKSIEFSTRTFNIRHGTGGYLINSQYVTSAELNKYFRISSFNHNVITFTYNAASALSGTNNTPISVELSNLKLIFK